MSDVLKINHKATLNHGSKLARDLAISKVNQGNQAGICWLGEPTQHLGVSNTGGNALPVQNLVYDARLLVAYYLPSLGGKKGEEKASEAFTRMYNAMTGTAYTTTEFGKADLEKHTVIGEGFVTLLDRIDRYLDCFNLVEYVNKGPQWLKDNLFKNSNSASYADLVAKRNELVPYLNKLILPSNIPAIGRHRAMCRNVYTDDVHDKTQLIICEPIIHYMSINAIDDAAYLSISSASNIDEVIDILYRALRTYVESAFYNTISPYLYRSMLDPNGPKIAKAYDFQPYEATLKPKTTLDAVYDIELIQMLRNADYVGNFFNSDASVSENNNFNIFEDDEGVCRQGRLAEGVSGLGIRPILIQVADSATSTPDSMSWGNLTDDVMDTVYAVSDDDHVLNMEDFPTPEDALYVSMNGLVVTQNIAAGTAKSRIVEYSGDAIFTHLSIVMVSATDPTLVRRFSAINIVSENDVPASGKKIAKSGLIAKLAQNGAAESYYLNGFEIIGALNSFDCAPTQYIVYIDFNASIFKVVSNFKDIDNLVRIPKSALINYAKLNIFDNFNMTASDGSRSEGRSHGKRRDKKAKGKESPKKGEDGDKAA